MCSTTTGYTVAGLTNGTRYYFRVFARNVVGQSPASNTASAVPRTKPTAPRSLAAAATNVSGQIRLTWVAPSSNGGSAITDYVIQRSPNGSSSWVTINDGVRSTTGYTVGGLANGTRYYFRVFARNVAGQSPASNTANAIPVNALTAPRSLAASARRPLGQIRLTWIAPSSNGGSAITDYIIQRSPNGSSGWVTINDGVSTATALHGGRPDQRHPLLLPGLCQDGESNESGEQRRQRHPAHQADGAPLVGGGGDERVGPDPPHLGGAVVERRLGDHRLRHPTLTERFVELGDDQRWCAQHHGLHRGRSGQRHPLLLPGLRPQRRRATAPASTVVSAIPRTITVPGVVSYFEVYSDYSGFYLYWGDPVSTGGSPITEFVVQAYDYDDGSWFTLGYAEPSQRDVFVDAPGYGCGMFRIAAINAVGVGPYQRTSRGLLLG